ncbi:hypothetical protein AGMMS50276_24580 [Synergistales bacterium]|nr:hypothetical protein AGMMS50276_24580 [Synergistales bacterium]
MINKKISNTTFRVVILVLLLCAAVSSPACAAVRKEKKLNIVTSAFPPYDFTRSITGDRAEIFMLLKPGSEPHSFDPSPSDIIKIRDCDLFVYVGGESDSWVNGILESLSANEKKPEILRLIDSVNAVKDELMEGMTSYEEELGYDGHIWTSPANAKKIVKTLSDTICRLDRRNAKLYQRNADSEIARIDELDAAFRTIVDVGVRRTIIFADRFPFRYFTDYYNLNYYAAFPGCSSETDAGALTVSFLINKVRSEKIPVVFFVEFSNEKMADVVISVVPTTKKLLLHSAHNVSKADFEGGATYISIMKRNLENLKEALN